MKPQRQCIELWERCVQGEMRWGMYTQPRIGAQHGVPERDMGENRQKNRDRVTLSSRARKQSVLETLLKQRQELAEQKKGEAQNDTQSQSDAQTYHERIAALDETIAQVKAEREAEESTFSGIYERPKTSEQQAEAEKAKWLMDVAAVYDQAQAMLSLRVEMLGRGNLLASKLEIEHHAAMMGGIGIAQETTALRMAAIQLSHQAMDAIQGLADSPQEEAPPSEESAE